MADYTVIVDDSDPQIIYGPGPDSWSLSLSDHTFHGTLHQTASSADLASFEFYFVGGREVLIRGNIASNHNATVPGSLSSVFQVNAQSFLSCFPESPQSGDTFLCSKLLPPEIMDYKLQAKVLNSEAVSQHFQIDFIRYGTSSRVAESTSGLILFSQAPNRTTPGLEPDQDWETFQSVMRLSEGGFATGLRTSTLFSKAIYRFVGTSVDWWSCCVLPSDDSNTWSMVSYAIDGGDLSFVTIDKSFELGPQCINERVLFQMDQLQPGNHTLEVVYLGNQTTTPLTLCALAASPVDFSVLDAIRQTSSNPSNSSATHSSPEGSVSGHPGTRRTMTLIISVVFGVATALALSIGAILWCRRRHRANREAQKKRLSTDTILQLSYHPVGGFINPEKRNSAVGLIGDPWTPRTHTSENNGENSPRITTMEASQMESRPPSYRSGHSRVESPLGIHPT